MPLSTTVGAVLCAAHRDRLGKLHGHTWTVWARFPQDQSGLRDALVLQTKLRAIVDVWDHDELPDDLASGERLAEAIAILLGDADLVRLERLPEMIVAEWTA